MHWYELLIFSVSGLSIATTVVIGALAWRYFRDH